METVLDLYNGVRTSFPGITAKADKIHVEYWGAADPESAYVWFESLARAMNQEMEDEVPYKSHAALFDFVVKAIMKGKPQLVDCVDTSFVENLFWKVPRDKAKKYWSPLPSQLKELYVRFHRRTPL